ncbi:DUF4227 family protein [Paenibacillus protaetiae]|uniref:DUF4227 family protein n=2 Tax=Paenibacillus protaetiae TaxID=2509456 RepID=A0A4P6EZ42_9BACL|nr:DUF4227 family protein [Paenibacillus protaetiae]
MIVSVRRWLARILFLIAFAILFLVATGGYRLLIDAISPVHPYQEPRGHAAKVFRSDPEIPGDNNPLDRLRWFFWYGE